MKPSPLTYESPGKPGSLGGVQAFAEAQGLKPTARGLKLHVTASPPKTFPYITHTSVKHR